MWRSTSAIGPTYFLPQIPTYLEEGGGCGFGGEEVWRKEVLGEWCLTMEGEENVSSTERGIIR